MSCWHSLEFSSRHGGVSPQLHWGWIRRSRPLCAPKEPQGWSWWRWVLRYGQGLALGPVVWESPQGCPSLRGPSVDTQLPCSQLSP